LPSLKTAQSFSKLILNRISGFVGAIEKFGNQLNGATVADRGAGKALALLCVYAGISQVYAEVLSKKAQAVFEENQILFELKEIVDNVLDLNKAGVCPFEKVAADISDPQGFLWCVQGFA
jgi:predicted RNA methylase